MASQLSQKRAFDSPAIPDRLYFKIGDVAKICAVETYVLRFWETEFPQLKPNKSGTGQRLYRRRDVELALEIKRLVHVEGYTLAGARQVLGQGNRHSEAQRDPEVSLTVVKTESGKSKEDVAATIGRARAELREIAGLLASPEPKPRHRRSRMTALPDPADSLFPI
jgi:DNA-binding transcriptional MerR regulator